MARTTRGPGFPGFAVPRATWIVIESFPETAELRPPCAIFNGFQLCARFRQSFEAWLQPLKVPKPAVKVFVATTVMLTFISFWRASAIVLSDLASSAYYAGGDAEKVIGKSAPWFILAVMLFSYAVRALYIESSSMFVRGGVYRVVKEAMGGTLAKFSVSALLFDYVLTGPISAVSAGQYLAGFIKDIGVYFFHRALSFSDNYFAAGFALIIVIYFWWKNTQGIHESSQKALQIMAITTVMVVILIIWCTITVLRAPVQLPPNPLHAGVVPLNKESLGWLNGTWFSHSFSAIWIIVFVGFGHSVLAMSGEETLAQVNREIEHPKLKNLEKTGLVIFIYSLLFTSLVSFFAVMIIPDNVRPDYFANLIGGIAMYLVGPTSLKLLFHGFVVLVGVLILAGAQNTSIVGANGVLNRVAEDGVLTSWFQKPHHRYGTSYRIINLIVCMQLLTIILSRGDVYQLAALYAFGVIWSFTMKSLAVLVLRFTEPGNRAWKVPGNLHIGKTEIPDWADRCFRGSVHDRDCESVHQISGHDCRRCLQHCLLHDLHDLRASRRQGAPRQARTTRPVPGVRQSGIGQRRDGSAAGKYSGGGARSAKSLLPAARARPHAYRQAGCGGHERATVSSRAQFQRQRGVGGEPGIRPLRAGTIHRGRRRRGKRRQADLVAGGSCDRCV